MNFYGHAHLATRIDPDPAHVLGSMLPDFEGMCGMRLSGIDDESIARGVALHHETDDVFHRAPEFLELCAVGVEQLVGAGVARGSARACAHVGTELLLDGFVLQSHGPNESYLEALDVAARDALGSALRFPDDGARFESLRQRLRVYGLPTGYTDPEFVTARLFDALASRPRLALEDRSARDVVRWLGDAIPRVRRIGPRLLDRLEDDIVVRPR